MRILRYAILMLLSIGLSDELLAAPSNGTRFPPKGRIETGYQYNAIFERTLRNTFGDLKTRDHFYTLSFGVFDWLALDGQAGLGDISEVNGKLPKLEYNTGFAGGYGFRIMAYQNKEWGMRAILGGQHISVHPHARSIDDNKYEAIMDDWQVSGLIAKDIRSVTLYAGLKGSDCSIIYKLNNHDRKRVSSERHIGLVTGLEIYILGNKGRVNTEARFFDEAALTASYSYMF